MDPNCKNDNWPIEELDQYVIQAIQDLLVLRNDVRLLSGVLLSFFNSDSKRRFSMEDLLGNEKLLAEIIDSCQHNPILPTTDQKKLENRILEIDKHHLL